jgi:hypothetical protein
VLIVFPMAIFGSTEKGPMDIIPRNPAITAKFVKNTKHLLFDQSSDEVIRGKLVDLNCSEEQIEGFMQTRKVLHKPGVAAKIVAIKESQKTRLEIERNVEHLENLIETGASNLTSQDLRVIANQSTDLLNQAQQSSKKLIDFVNQPKPGSDK